MEPLDLCVNSENSLNEVFFKFFASTTICACSAKQPNLSQEQEEQAQTSLKKGFTYIHALTQLEIKPEVASTDNTEHISSTARPRTTTKRPLQKKPKYSSSSQFIRERSRAGRNPVPTSEQPEAATSRRRPTKNQTKVRRLFGGRLNNMAQFLSTSWTWESMAMARGTMTAPVPF